MTFNHYPESEDGRTNLTRSDIAIVGVPFDGGTPGTRGGQRSAPDAIRRLEAFDDMTDPFTGEDYFSVNVVDCGDVPVHQGNAATTHESIQVFVEEIQSNTDLVIVIGGDHSITPWVMGGLFGYEDDESKKPIVIHFDAHSDTWPHNEYGEDSTNHHGSWVRYVLENEEVSALHQFGIRGFVPGVEQQDDSGWPLYRWQHSDTATALLIAEKAVTSNTPVYVSVDLDVVDPAFAPGVVCPEPGGITSANILYAIENLVKIPSVKGIDIVECSPPLDHGELTVRLAHRSVVAAIKGYAMRKPRTSGDEEPVSSPEGETHVLDVKQTVALPTDGGEDEEQDGDLQLEMATRGTRATAAPGRGGRKGAGRAGAKKAAKKGAKKAGGGAKKAAKKTTKKAAKKSVKKAAKKTVSPAKTTAKKATAKKPTKAAKKALAKKVGRKAGTVSRIR